MAGSFNRATIIGNCGKDPEIRSTQSGNRIANLSIATSENWTDKQSGEKKERVDWHRIVVFNERLVEVIEQYVHKGDKLLIEGAIRTRKYQDQSGADRYTTEIVLQGFDSRLIMLGKSGGGGRPGAESSDDYGDTRSRSTGGGYGGGGSGSAGAGSGGGRSRTTVDDLDDPIPFASSDAAAEPCLRKQEPIL